MKTAVIITTNANRELAHLHERMPVVVPPEAYDFWLDCDNVDATTAAALFVPAREGFFEAYEISPAVNRTANDGPELIAPFVAEEAAPANSAPPAGEPPKRKKKPVKDERQSSLF